MWRRGEGTGVAGEGEGGGVIPAAATAVAVTFVIDGEERVRGLGRGGRVGMKFQPRRHHRR